MAAMHVLLLLLVCLLQLCLSLRGLDLILPLSVQQWADLNIDFAVVRVQKQTGEIDYTGIKNLRRAQEANITDLAAYMYPCIPSSYYAQVEGIECLSASRQLEALRSAMDDNAVGFEKYESNTWPPTNAPTEMPSFASIPTPAPTEQPTGQPTTRPTGQPSAAPSAPPSGAPTVLVGLTDKPTVQPTFSPTATLAPSSSPSGVPTSTPTNVIGTVPLNLKRIYLMVEDESPPRYFSADQNVNIAYITELAERAYDNGIQLGVFTTLRYWSELMETNTGQVAEFSRDNVPLWIPRFDKTPSMDFFVPFGGWTKVHMKQYWGGSSPARRLDSTWRLNDNYIEWHLNDTSIDPLP